MLIHDLEEKMPNDIKVTGERNAELRGQTQSRESREAEGRAERGRELKGGCVFTMGRLFSETR